MTDYRTILERDLERVTRPAGFTVDDVRRRRDRKRRNQRITAGVVGIAVFVAAVWIVTSGLSFDRSQTPAVPGSKTGPMETAPPSARASAPEVVRRGRCSDGARSRLELEIVAPVLGRVGAWFVLHRSPLGHEWRIELRHYANTSLPAYDEVVRTRVASDSGDLTVYRSARDSAGPDGFVAKALDTQTGQRCRVQAQIG
jgi:hypothetical protein